MIPNLIRGVVGIAVLVAGLAVIGLDIHVAFRTTQFAHTSNLVAAVFIVCLGVAILLPMISAAFWTRLTGAVSAWRTGKP